MAMEFDKRQYFPSKLLCMKKANCGKVSRKQNAKNFEIPAQSPENVCE